MKNALDALDVIIIIKRDGDGIELACILSHKQDKDEKDNLEEWDVVTPEDVPQEQGQGAQAYL